MIGEMIAAQAETWIGVPFVWQGRVRAGCDCKGLVAGVFAELDRPEAQSIAALAGDYGDRVPTDRLRAGLAELFDEVNERQPVLRPFDRLRVSGAQDDRAADGRMPGDILLCVLKGAAQHLALAAPTELRPDRAIEAMPSGPGCVRPALWPAHRVDSIWRVKR